jgi:hypothetical protein
MIRIYLVLASTALLVLLALTPGSAIAQDVPGVSLGGMVERRVENRIGGSDLGLTFYGIRLGFRDEGRITIHGDIGRISLDHALLDVDDAMGYRFGGTFWLAHLRSAEVPVVVGLEGSAQVATFSGGSALSGGDLRYEMVVGQIVGRSEVGVLKPYIKVGMASSRISTDRYLSALDHDEGKRINTAINIGAIYSRDWMTIGLEMSYQENIGAGLCVEYWF